MIKTRKSNTLLQFTDVLCIIITVNCLKNLTLNLKEEIALLSKYRITPNELMLVRTLLILQDEDTEDLFKDYIELLHDCGIKLREVLLSLQEKGIILKNFKVPKEGEAFNPYSIPFNKTSIKTLYKCSFELGKELFEEYPQMTNINGTMVTLRGVSKHFNSLEDCYFRYGRNIKWDEERHKYIIELVKWAKEHDLIKQSLSSFVINNAWLDLEAIRNGDSGNYNFDTIRVL